MPYQVPYEEPFAPLDFDPIDAPSSLVLGRLYAVTNAMVKEGQRMEANREALMGSDKKSLEYKAANIHRYSITDRMDALKRKYDTLSHTIYHKSAEMRMASK